MEELKDYILDRISYLEKYDPSLYCFGLPFYEIEIKIKTLQDVLDKLREIEKKEIK